MAQFLLAEDCDEARADDESSLEHAFYHCHFDR
jgi:hypothetical protein